MPEEDRRRRCTAMANAAAAHSPSVWLKAQLDALD
jgi:hypothetical protein